MKIKKIITYLLLIFMLTGCNINTEVIKDTEGSNDNINTVVLTESFIKLAGTDTDGVISWIKEEGNNNFVELFSNQDDTVTMKVTEGQIDFWNNLIEKKLKDIETKIGEDKFKRYCNFSNNYRTINYFNNMNSELGKSDVLVAEAPSYCALYQLINGNEECQIEMNIYNCDTEKLITRVGLGESVSYTRLEWDKSYRLNKNEEKKQQDEVQGLNCNKYKFRINTIPAIEALEIFGTICDGEYTYRYINAEGEVVLGFTEEQKEEVIDKCSNYIDEIKTQFQSLNSLYDLKVNEDYSKMEMSFNSELEEQEQGNYVGYTTTSCMLMRALRGENDINLDYYINNCDTGKLAGKGNTEDGISFNVKQ